MSTNYNRTLPKSTAHSRESSATLFLSEKAEHQRLVTNNIKSQTNLRSKVLAEAFSSSDNNGRNLRSIAGPPPRHVVYSSRGQQASASSQFLSNYPVSTSPDLTTGRYGRRRQAIGIMQAGNRSDGALQLLRSKPSMESVSTVISETSSHTTQKASQIVHGPNTYKPYAPNVYSTRSLRSCPSSPEESLPSDPRQHRWHGTGDIQSYLLKRSGIVQHISPSSQVGSRVPSPLPEADAAIEQDDDTSDHSLSSYAPTFHATQNSDRSSKTTTTEPDNISALPYPPKPPMDLPPVDRSPLFTDQEKDTVIHFLKRISSNLSGKQRKVPRSERPPSTMTYQTSEVSWEARSRLSTNDSESVQRVYPASIAAQKQTTEPRRRLPSGASTVSSLLRSLGPGRPQADRVRDIDPTITYSGVTRQSDTGSTIRRNKTWTPLRTDKVQSGRTPWSQKQRIWQRDANGKSMPPPSRGGLLLQSQSMDFAGDGVYRVIMPDLPRSTSLRLSSTTSLSALEETIRYRQRVGSKASIATAFNIGPVSGEEPDNEAGTLVEFPSMQTPYENVDDPRASSPPIGMRSDNASVRTLSTPFLYRPTTRSQTLGTTKTLVSPTDSTTPTGDEIGLNETGAKSFMDISPDPEIDSPEEKSHNQSKLKMFWKKARAGIASMLEMSLPGKKRRVGCSEKAKDTLFPPSWATVDP